MTTETKVGHTPGPWEVSRHGTVLVRGPCGPERHIATLEWDDAQGRADGRMMAAAPLLLEALRDLLEGVEDPDHEPGDWSQRVVAAKARAAIARATEGA